MWRCRNQPDRTPLQARHLRRGQAIIESSLVLGLVCLVLFGLFEISQLFAAQEILDYAAARGARAETVGFNSFMVDKIVRVGAIPNAGRLINPVVIGGPAAQSDAEMARIPLYLGGESDGRLTGILDYDHWDSINSRDPVLVGVGLIRMHIGQEYDLTGFPFSKAFYSEDVLSLSGEAYMENHYPLYMNNEDYVLP
ncbi:MAG: TadE/TadG family type IV pilus assembly protein [bacterium]